MKHMLSELNNDNTNLGDNQTHCTSNKKHNTKSFKAFLEEKRNMKSKPKFEVENLYTDTILHEEIISNNSIKKFLEQEMYVYEGYDESSVKLEDLNEYKKYYKNTYETMLHSKFNLNSIIIAIMAFNSMIAAISNFEILRANGSNYKSLTSQYICFITSFLLWLLIIRSNFIKAEIECLNKNLNSSLQIWSFEFWFYTILEILFFLLHPNPVFEGLKAKEFIVPYRLQSFFYINSMMTIFTMLRFVYIVKTYMIQSIFYSQRTARLGRLWGADISIFYAFKCMFVAYPYRTYILLFSLILVIGSYSSRIFEVNSFEESGLNYINIWNALWAGIINMFTVGYGDFYPTSIGGRIIGIIICISASFLTSLTVSTFTNILTFDNQEIEIYNNLCRLNLKSKEEEICGKLIYKYTKSIRIINKFKENPTKENKEEVEKLKFDFFKHLYEFKDITSKLSDTIDPPSELDFYLNKMNELEEKIKYLSHGLVKIREKISNYSSMFEKLLEIK